MATNSERAPSNEREINWFNAELNVYGSENKREQPSDLILLASKLRTSRASSQDVGKIKRCVLHFINANLEEADIEVVRDFLSFLHMSEMMEDSTEIRMSLYYVLKRRLATVCDALAIEIATSLLRSRKVPSSQAIVDIHSRARVQFLRSPSWQLVSVLALGIGAIKDYSLDAFIDDVKKLRSLDATTFERKLSLREPFWSRLPQPLSAKYIISRVDNSAMDKMERSLNKIDFRVGPTERTAAFVE